MGLWKRGNVWWAYFYIDGARHQLSTGTSNRRQAEQVFQKAREEANANRHRLVQVDPNLTFGALAARFIANAAPKPHHLEKLRRLLPYFADTPILRITKGMAREYRQYRHSLSSVTDATINRDLAVMKHLLYWGIDEGLLPANPLARLKLERERRIRRPVVTLQEELGLLEVAPEHLKRMTAAALDTGMRRGEILHQLWEHVDFERRLLFVTRSKTPEGEAREIPLTSRMFRLLSEHPQEQGPIFVYGERPVQSIKTAWRNALKNAGLRHIRFHDLRHTFNTRLMEAGVMQEVRKALMGHSSGESVHATYTHVELPIKRDAIAKLEEWVNGQKQKLQQKGGDNGTIAQAS